MPLFKGTRTDVAHKWQHLITCSMSQSEYTCPKPVPNWQYLVHFLHRTTQISAMIRALVWKNMHQHLPTSFTPPEQKNTSGMSKWSKTLHQQGRPDQCKTRADDSYLGPPPKPWLPPPPWRPSAVPPATRLAWTPHSGLVPFRSPPEWQRNRVLCRPTAPLGMEGVDGVLQGLRRRVLGRRLGRFGGFSGPGS